jgi:uroporphyrinogen-III synthase
MRPVQSLQESIRKAESIGFIVAAAPMVELRPMEPEAFGAFLRQLSAKACDYVVFTSANGASIAFDLAKEMVGARLFREGLSHSEIVAIGPKTRWALEEAGVGVRHMPTTYSSAGLVELFAKLKPATKSITILRSRQGDKSLVRGLQNLGAHVKDIAIYEISTPRDRTAAESLIKRVADGEIDAFCFTSAMSAKNFMDIASSLGLKDAVIAQMNRGCVGAIGVPTAKVLMGDGVQVKVSPTEHTFDALLDGIAAKLKIH